MVNTLYIFPLGPEVWVVDADTGEHMHREPVAPGEDHVTVARRLAKVYRPHYSVFWVPDPHAHPAVRKIVLESTSDEEGAPPSVPPPANREALQVLREMTHLCFKCAHDNVCIMSDAVRRVDSAMAVINACLEFVEVSAQEDDT